MGNLEVNRGTTTEVGDRLNRIAGILRAKHRPFDPITELKGVEPGAILPFITKNAGAVIPASTEVLTRFIPGYTEPNSDRLGELSEYAQRAENYGTMPGQAMSLVESITEALQPSNVFVFGTARGRIESIIAKAGPTSDIVTIDLPQEQVGERTIDANNLRYRQKIGITTNESIGDIFRMDSEVNRRVHQLLADSFQFDASILANTMRLIVIDGNHSVENVLKDLRNAFIMADKNSGAVIILDDFRKVSPLNSGVEAAAVNASSITGLPVLHPSPKPGENGFGADAGVIVVPAGFEIRGLVQRFDSLVELLKGQN